MGFIKALIIPKSRIPVKKTLKLEREENKYGVRFEGEFYPVDPKKVFLVEKFNWFTCTLRYIPFIILSTEYNSDIIHSLSKERFQEILRKQSGKVNED